MPVKTHQTECLRLFNMNEAAKMFIKKGDLGTICHAVPITFQGYF